jgi:hypothetical protein
MTGAGSSKKGRLPRPFRPWRLAAVLGPVLMVLAVVLNFRHSGGSAPVRVSTPEATEQVQPSVSWLRPPALPSTRSLNLLLVGHELTLTGAPGSFLEVGQSLRDQGHNITFVFLKGGDLEQAVQEAGFAYSFIPNLRAHPRLHAYAGAGWLGACTLAILLCFCQLTQCPAAPHLPLPTCLWLQPTSGAVRV